MSTNNPFFRHSTLLNATSGHYGQVLKAEADQLNALIKEAVMVLKSTSSCSVEFIFAVNEARDAFASYASNLCPKTEYNASLARALEARAGLL